jgi:hypothetical protein
MKAALVTNVLGEPVLALSRDFDSGSVEALALA